MSNKNPAPFVPAEVRHGRLVRLCPVCKEHIVEHTDEEGMVTNSFAEHYEVEHAAEPEPEVLRLYVLGAQPAKGRPGIRDTSGINRSALDHVRRQPFEHDVEWQLVERLEDLPEGAPVVQASHVLVAGFARDSDPPHIRQIRWFKREGDHLVFTPTVQQLAAYDEATRRLMDARFVLLDRHRDELPKLEVEEDITGTEDTLEAYDRFRAEAKPLEDAITKDLNTAQDVARHQFFTGAIEWLATIDDAITAAKISDDEIPAKREWFVAREAEIDRTRAAADNRNSCQSRLRAAGAPPHQHP